MCLEWRENFVHVLVAKYWQVGIYSAALPKLVIVSKWFGKPVWYVGMYTTANVRCQSIRRSELMQFKLYYNRKGWMLTITSLFSSCELYYWWDSSERWDKPEGRKSRNLYWQDLGHNLWHILGQPWSSGGMQATWILFKWLVSLHPSCMVLKWEFFYSCTIICKCLLWTWHWSLTSWPTWLHWQWTDFAQLLT